MWEKVASRHHKPLKVFPYGSKSNEVMLFGTVHYGLKDGRKASVDWAARARLVKENDAVKMDFYQVYLVRAPTISDMYFSCCSSLIKSPTGYRCSKRGKIGLYVDSSCVKASIQHL